jgi:hypothetical protein
MLGDFFSSADGSTVYTQDATVSAMYQGSTYNWIISYIGNITWADPNSGVVGSISDSGGADVVLKGLSSVIVPIGLPGDFNSDGKVDAADYVVWRKTDGSQPGYDEWRANVGRTAGASAAGQAAGAIPEPAAILLLLAALAAGLILRRAK